MFPLQDENRRFAWTLFSDHASNREGTVDLLHVLAGGNDLRHLDNVLKQYRQQHQPTWPDDHLWSAVLDITGSTDSIDVGISR